jgi:F0F1-type ATP synthase alpha subunit
VPTQRAIKAFIAGQIGGGGASLNVNSVTAGSIFISSNIITTTTLAAININATVEFRGGVIGLPIAFNYFLA